MAIETNEPLVSVIIPAYNAEAFIGETLKSVLAQTYGHMEVLVVDDGSADCTANIVTDFSQSDNRVRLFRQKNRGVAAARNLGIDAARGDYIAPIDADDIWYPTKVERQVRKLEDAGPKTAAAYTWSVSIDEKGNLLDAGPMWDLEGEVYQALVLRNFIGNASVPMFRRSALERIGGYNEDLRLRNAQGCEDWELCLRVAEHFDYCVVADYLVGYRCYSQSMSYNHGAMGKSYALVMNEVQRRHPEIPASLYRWSKSIFYLYLTNKSNACGDLPHSLHWLCQAVRHDPAVLVLPWVLRCLLNRMLRTAVYVVTRDRRAWHQFRKSAAPIPPGLSYEQIVEESKRRRARRLWEKLQEHRWALVTNGRSISC